MAQSDYTAEAPDLEEVFPGRMDLDFEGKTIRLDQGNPRLSVGRDEDNTLSISNRYVSRHHCAIEFKRGRFVFTDTSSNGTYIVDGERQVQVVRGGKAFLPEKGLMGLGYRPDKPEAAVLRFRILEQTIENPDA